jgi:hypothetical protein
LYLPSGIPARMLYALLHYPKRSACRKNVFLPDFITPVISEAD